MIRHLIILVTGLAAFVPPVHSAAALTLRSVSFSLDWTYQGNHGIWALAQEEGLFAEEGLQVTMDRGYGSGDTVMKVAAGTYDIGFTDINAVIKFNAENPDQRVVAFYQVFDRTPNSVITLTSSGIKTPADLAGRNIGAPEADSSRLMFPAFAEVNNIDPASITWTSMAPNLREAMLVQGQVDAITGFSSTSFFNLVTAGVDRGDIKLLTFADNGLDLYGSALVATPAYIEANPEIIRSFVEATVAGTISMVENPKGAMAALKSIEPLFDPSIELERLDFLIDSGVLVSPAFEENGVGYVDPIRMAETIRVNSEVYGFEQLDPSEVYTTEFLPEESERMLPN